MDITKEFSFSASHRLKDVPPDHKCARLHGHNYTVSVSLSGDPGPDGMVLDYGEMAPFKAFIDSRLDHRHLGCWHVYDGDGKITDPCVVDFNPTAELLADFLLRTAMGMFGDLVAFVEVKETDGTNAVAYAS